MSYLPKPLLDLDAVSPGIAEIEKRPREEIHAHRLERPANGLLVVDHQSQMAAVVPCLTSTLLQRQELVPLLPALINERDLRTSAIRAVASYDHESLGRILVHQFNEYNPQEQGEALQTLCSRTSYGRLFKSPKCPPMWRGN